MSKMTNVLAFLSGVAVGGVVTWYYTKDTYARIAEEEINSVKEVYAKQEKKLAGEDATTDKSKVFEKPSLVEYAKRLQSEGYREYSSTVEKKEEVKQNAGAVPYVIPPEEFGEIEEYTKVSLLYFSDGVLTDDDNEPVDDVEEIVGDALEHFGEYEEDAVYVRNDAKKCDYEILTDVRNFKDVLADMPPRDD